MSKRIVRHRYHSAITGKYVSKRYADQNPDTTVKLTTYTCDLEDEFDKFLDFVKKEYGLINNSNNLAIVSDYMGSSVFKKNKRL